MTQINSTQEIIEDLKLGKMVILMDDEDRENEGDLIVAADSITPEIINFMAKYGRGLICMPITQERAELLNLSPQTSQNNAQFSTNFTVSIEAAKGVTTGISAYDRATTIKAATNFNAKAEDIVQPGHIFPIVAQSGGVLTRAGHTEAGCDLALLAGFTPAAVIVEILNDDGTMARRPDLEIFAKQHGLKIGTIADLIAFRLQTEKTIEKVAQTTLKIRQQNLELVTYKDKIEQNLHYALVKGQINKDEPTFVRVHMQNIFTDLFETPTKSHSTTLNEAITKLETQEKGVIVILSDASSSDDIIKSINKLNNSGNSESQENSANNQDSQTNNGKELRTYGVGAQILADLNVEKMKLLSSPKKLSNISGFNLEVVEYIS